MGAPAPQSHPSALLHPTLPKPFLTEQWDFGGDFWGTFVLFLPTSGPKVCIWGSWPKEQAGARGPHCLITTCELFGSRHIVGPPVPSAPCGQRRGLLFISQQWRIGFGENSSIQRVWVLGPAVAPCLSFPLALPHPRWGFGGLSARGSRGAPVFCNGLYRNKYCCSLLP